MASALAARLPVPTTNVHGYLQAVREFPLLSADEERELSLRYREDNDLDAAWRLVTSHLRYVGKVARG
jgi:RNA polymerase sigma-32 factor